MIPNPGSSERVGRSRCTIGQSTNVSNGICVWLELGKAEPNMFPIWEARVHILELPVDTLISLVAVWAFKGAQVRHVENPLGKIVELQVIIDTSISSAERM